MCRSIKTLRPPATPDVTEDDIRAAALQYIRKVSGFRAPAEHNREVFEQAVDAVTAATHDLLAGLHIRGRSGGHGHGDGGDGTVQALGALGASGNSSSARTGK
ncbi:DUF2277 domain-containing protein [Streptomyces paromomycinus]|uniref:DUF2277 domain-containing protein n=1 Tax=Streptomyces paromomycinus TaxID=92743 RepID=A0A401WE93_STREY|nr:DUF2277 domain-containing protein [Streptomyces paromomycinus]GCD47675.1 hypothetical protein GKJPGBOP_07468 [Streptomyces paromomycinus]